MFGEIFDIFYVWKNVGCDVAREMVPSFFMCSVSAVRHVFISSKIAGDSEKCVN
jgi:hypothetical protein